ncbi:MAG: putative phage abortive infection protein [Cocleimonas sp.]|nr:putative phage abortive infection protein [Cocleimonas sp.]
MGKKTDIVPNIPWIKTIVVVAAIVSLSAIIFYWYKFGFGLWDTPEKWGALGDFFGGILNPILAFLSLILLLITLQQNQKALSQNKKALDQNKDALQMNSQELALTREEVEGSKKALELQASILQKQNFEGTFFQLLSLYNEIVDSMDINDKTGRDCFEPLYKELKEIMPSIVTNYHSVVSRGALGKSIDQRKLSILIDEQKISNKDLNTIYLDFYSKKQNEIGHYFRVLYNIMKFIENNAPKEEAKMYSNLVRAQLSTYELPLVFYNCLSDEGEKFKPLIEKYSLLKFLPQDKEFLIFRGKELEFYKYSAYK